MRIITLNCNGIRAASRKGFFDWLPAQEADIVCLQETKAQIDQLSDPVFHPEGYHCYYFDAVKKGYSGTALFSRVEPDRVHRGIGLDIADEEGRGGSARADIAAAAAAAAVASAAASCVRTSDSAAFEAAASVVAAAISAVAVSSFIE